jgi:hypothetical protein
LPAARVVDASAITEAATAVDAPTSHIKILGAISESVNAQDYATIGNIYAVGVTEAAHAADSVSGRYVPGTVGAPAVGLWPDNTLIDGQIEFPLFELSGSLRSGKPPRKRVKTQPIAAQPPRIPLTTALVGEATIFQIDVSGSIESALIAEDEKELLLLLLAD